jgi:pyruvate formate lyase activating enzyme
MTCLLFDIVRNSFVDGPGIRTTVFFKGCKLWIRIPVIPGVNDTGKETEKIRDFLANFPTPERIELLPYHALGEHKYAALNKESQTFCMPPADHLAQLKNIFHS